jgi:hypothetical protein
MIALRVLVFLIGLATVVAILYSAIRTFVLPRSIRDRLTRQVFVAVRRIFNLATSRARSYEQVDRVMAYYAPVGLLCLPVVWLIIVSLAYAAMFWALGAPDLRAALTDSGSSLLTLGFAPITSMPTTLLAFSEAAVGLLLITLLISYLPTIYSAFARREADVNMLTVRAGSPPACDEMILRYQRIHGLEQLHDVWLNWERWFTDVHESHTSLAVLPFFRSPQPANSWITAAGAILDTAATINAALDMPHDPQADLCIRAGYLALRDIARNFRIPFDPDPRPDDPISITRQEFDEVLDRLAAGGVALKPDREQAWRDFSGWRVNYDTVLLGLALLVLAPYAPWSSDRSLRSQRPDNA